MNLFKFGMNIELTKYQIRIKEIAVQWAVWYEITHSDDYLPLIDEEIMMYDMLIESFPFDVKMDFTMLDEEEKQNHVIYDYLMMADNFIQFKEQLYNYPFEI